MIDLVCVIRILQGIIATNYPLSNFTSLHLQTEFLQTYNKIRQWQFLTLLISGIPMVAHGDTWWHKDAWYFWEFSNRHPLWSAASMSGWPTLTLRLGSCENDTVGCIWMLFMSGSAWFFYLIAVVDPVIKLQGCWRCLCKSAPSTAIVQSKTIDGSSSKCWLSRVTADG